MLHNLSRVSRSFLVFAAFSLVLVAVPQAVVAATPEIHQKKLANGVSLVVSPNPALRLTAVEVWVRAGSAFEGPEEGGAAHFLEHVLFKGTRTRPPGTIDLEIENVGASLAAQTSKDWARFYTTVATEYLDSVLEVLADVIQNPLFDIGEVDVERRIIKSEIVGRRFEPGQVLSDALAARLYPSHPYTRPVYGTILNAESVTPRILREFHQRTYTGPAMTVVVVGNVDQNAIFGRLEKLFAGVSSVAAADWPPRPAPLSQAVEENLPKAPGDQEWIGFAFLGPGMDTPGDVWAVDVLSVVLARRGGGRLHDRLVTRDGSAREVDVNFLTQRLPAMISIPVAAIPGTLARVESAVLEEIRKLRSEPVGQSELEMAKRYLLGTYAFEVETAEGQAASLGFYSVLGNVEDSLSYTRNIAAVSADDVLRVAGEYLNPEKMVIVRLSE